MPETSTPDRPGLDHLRLVVAFLEHHPEIPDNPNVEPGYAVHWHFTNASAGWQDRASAIIAALPGARWVTHRQPTLQTLRTTTGSPIGQVYLYLPLHERTNPPPTIDAKALLGITDQDAD